MILFRLFLFTVFLVLISFGIFYQKPNLRKVQKKHNLISCVDYTPLSTYFSRDYQIFFGIHLSDSTTRIYNLEKDTIGSKVYTYFSRQRYSGIIGLTNNYWEIYFLKSKFENKKRNVQLKQIGQFDKSKFDSIFQVDYNYFVGYKNKGIILFYYRENEKKFYGFKEFSAHKKLLLYYDFGVFLEFKNDQTNMKEISFIDFKSGKPRAKFVADSIWCFPHTFNDFSVVKVKNEFFVYKFKNSTLIDQDFKTFYNVPIYDFPFIIKEDYVAFGDREWTKLSIPNVEKVTFKTFGDLVIAYAINKEGKTTKIDLWEKKITEE